MKFIVFDLTVGRPRSIPAYLPNYLKEHDCIEVLEPPENEYYLVIGIIQFIRWADSASKFKNNKIINDIREGKAGFILTADTEAFGLAGVFQRDRAPPGYQHNIVKYANIVENIKHGCQCLDLNPHSVMYVDNNYKIESIFKKYNLSAAWHNFYEKVMPPIDISPIIENIKNRKDREKKFLYFGGKGRAYRLAFVNELFKIPKLLDDSYISTSGGSCIDFFTKKSVFVRDMILDIKEVNDIPEKLCLINTNYHTSSYVNIIPMSYYHLDHSHLEANEKYYKPIINLQPFIVLGQPNTIGIVHDLGYKTFDKWIDESYDKTMDDRERFIKVVNEVRRINNMTHYELNDMLVDMLPTLEYNANLHRTRYYQKNYSLLDKILSKFNQTR